MARTLAGAIWSSTKLVPRSSAAAVVAGAVSAAVAAEVVVDMAVVAEDAAAATVEIAATVAIAAIAGNDFLFPDSCRRRLFIVDAASRPFSAPDARALFKSDSS